MCCLVTALMLLGPRALFLVYWLVAPVRVNLAMSQFNLPWLVGTLGLVFTPWTTLAFVMAFPLGGWDWLWIGLGLAADIFGYVGGYHNRRRAPGYPQNAW